MRFLSMIRIQENTGRVPSEQLMADMGRLIEQMTREGTLLDTAGLRPTAEGVRMRLRGGRISTVDGPFAETKEVIGGYAILQADSMVHALELTRRFLALHGDGWDLECEVRQIEGPDGECGAARAQAQAAEA
ncbi:YciI family protein [Fulvimonas yonginensis]|uniref:YciI family protein n=1 Tax=Fulvimonas yonginensis TaxID=1495200 RepID=A0ABU8JDJ6_9GAMM